jgi:hypothetical protein
MRCVENDALLGRALAVLPLTLPLFPRTLLSLLQALPILFLLAQRAAPEPL